MCVICLLYYILAIFWKWHISHHSPNNGLFPNFVLANVLRVIGLLPREKETSSIGFILILVHFLDFTSIDRPIDIYSIAIYLEKLAAPLYAINVWIGVFW